MAKIVLGIATSHGPLLSTPPDMWHLRAADDKKSTHPFRGGTYSFDELTKMRAGENLEFKASLKNANAAMTRARSRSRRSPRNGTR